MICNIENPEFLSRTAEAEEPDEAKEWKTKTSDMPQLGPGCTKRSGKASKTASLTQTF